MRVASKAERRARLAGSEISLNNLSGTLPIVSFALQSWGLIEVVAICFAWLGAFCLALSEQSRLEGACRALCGVTATTLVASRYCTHGHRPQLNRSFYALIRGIFLCLGSVAYLDESVRASTAALAIRLSGEDQQRGVYESGFMGSLNLENEHFKIFQECWDDFSPMERLAGRGMGGSFEWLTGNQNATNKKARLEREDKYWLEDGQKFGRRAKEIGWGNPFIKGGLLFSGWIMLASFVAITAAIRSRSPFAVVCGLVVLVNGIYRSFGGDFLVGSMAKMLGGGLSIGFLLSRGWRSDPWVGHLLEQVKPVNVRSTPTTPMFSTIT